LDLRETVRTLLLGLAAGAALTGLSTGPAAADQMVMPFSCSVIGGQVSLAPSAPQTYEIYGRAEHKRLTTCSPYDRRKCHNWSVHRFDLNCGGVRTSWQSVVAALSPILAESAGEAYAPYAGPAYGDQGRAGPYRRGPGGGIAFPRGFAPNPMKVAHFKRTGPAVADVPLPPKKPEDAPVEIAATDAKSRQASPEPTTPEPATSDAEAPPATQSKAATASKTPTEEMPVEAAEQQALTIEVDPAVTGSLSESGASAALWRDASTVFKWALALLFALTATLLFGRRRMETLPALVAQLRAPYAVPSPAHASAEIDEAAARSESERTETQQTETAASRLRLWDEAWLPGTMSEALDVLGVDPHASKDRIKTTVTRLRRALHPDYALDDEDRSLRERRLKQINVAWEIVSGKRRSLWLASKAPQ
jgi:DnaJ-domain-containing protein 1